MVAKIGTLVDKFAYVSLDTSKWTIIGDPTVANKRLKLDPLEGIVSKDEYDLTGSQFFAQVDPERVATDFYMRFETDPANSVSTELKGTDLLFIMVKNGVKSSSLIGYNETDHAQWRIRERFNTLIWETSPNGQNWVVQRTVEHSMDLTHGILTIYNAGEVLAIGYGRYGYGTLHYGSDS